jgi:flagellar biosynthesis/type III secretory pathway protein FliH
LSGKSKEDFEMVAEKNTEIRKAVDELYVLSSDKEVRLEYERRQKAIMDYNTHMEDHYLAGLKEGELKGRQEALMDYNTHMEDHFLAGMQEGELKGRQEGKEEGRKMRDEELLSLIRKGYTLEQLEKSLL